MNKINILRIIAEHVHTLRDFSTNRLSAADVVVFFGLPALLAGIAGWYRVGFNYDVMNALLTAFSIFAGLLLNLLLLVFSFADRLEVSGSFQSVRQQLLKEVHSNIAFAILVSMAIVVVAIVAVIRLKMASGPSYTGPILTGTLVYFIANFVLTLLMILKRMHILMSQQLKQSMKRSA